MNNSNPDWRAQIQTELRQAEAARAKGNEGQARVCARRAAGIAIGEYLQRRKLPNPGPSAMKRLQYLTTLPDLSPQVREVANHLVLRVNQDFEFPIQVDLIAEARWLAETLLQETIMHKE